MDRLIDRLQRPLVPKSLLAKLSSPAFRRDPLRMMCRPLLRHVELGMAQRVRETSRIRQLGNGASAEYKVSELLDRSRYLYGIHEYTASSVFVAQIAPGSLVLDIGANLGEYTVLAARSTGDRGHVIAYEPNPGARDRLARNVEVNGFSNVRVSPEALSSEDGEATLRVPHDESGLGTLRMGVYGSEYRVQMRRLDGLMSELDVQRLGVVKVDVEGLELQVFQGAQQTIARAKPVILYECAADAFIESEGRIVTPAMQFLTDQGYDNFVIEMTRGGEWALQRINRKDDPRRYREPWEVLVVVAIPQGVKAPLRGKSCLRPCGVFELIGR